MADCGDGLIGFDEMVDEGDGVLVDPQRIGIRNAAGQHQRVEIRCLRPG